MTHPFWVVHTLLARDIQEKAQMAHGIKEALTLIRREPQESATGFLLLDMIVSEFLDHPGEQSNEAQSFPPNIPPPQ